MNAPWEPSLNEHVIDKASRERGTVQAVREAPQLRRGKEYVVAMLDPLDTPAVRLYLADELRPADADARIPQLVSAIRGLRQQRATIDALEDAAQRELADLMLARDEDEGERGR